MNKVLVTGGAGFIGSHVADMLIENGYQVVIVDNLSSGKRSNIHQEAIFYELDICDSGLKDIFEKERPDFVNHHAAQINVRHSISNPEFDAKVNIIGLLNLLENCRRSGVKRIIFASSGGAVYGDAQQFPASEDFPPAPLSPYGVSKLAGEYYLQYYQQVYGMPFLALRYGNVYGPRQDNKGEAGVIAIFTEKMLAGSQPTINGDGEQTRDYIYVSDVARANLLGVQSSEAFEACGDSMHSPFSSGFCPSPGSCQSGIFNIGTGKETSVNELFSLLKQQTGFSGEAVHGPAIAGEVLRSCLNASKFSKLCGWSPQIALQEGIELIVTWREPTG